MLAIPGRIFNGRLRCAKGLAGQTERIEMHNGALFMNHDNESSVHRLTGDDSRREIGEIAKNYPKIR